LSLVEAGHLSAFDCADVDEHVLAAVIRLDESKALLTIEHFTVPKVLDTLEVAYVGMRVTRPFGLRDHAIGD
jgi:hypothetical protein